MACELTSGIAKDCRDSVGGLKKIYVTELANKATLTSSTEGLIDAFTLASTKQFWEYDLPTQTSDFQDITTVNRENGTNFQDQTLNAILNKGDVTKRNEIKLLAQNNVMVIALDRNGIYWLLGEANGMAIETAELGTGTAMGDRNGYTIVLKGIEEDAAQTVDSTLIATLILPAA